MYLGVFLNRYYIFSLQTNKKRKIKKLDSERLSSNRFAGYLLEQGLPDLRVFSNIYDSAGFPGILGKGSGLKTRQGFIQASGVAFVGWFAAVVVRAAEQDLFRGSLTFVVGAALLEVETATPQSR